MTAGDTYKRPSSPPKRRKKPRGQRGPVGWCECGKALPHMLDRGRCARCREQDHEIELREAEGDDDARRYHEASHGPEIATEHTERHEP